MQKIRSGLSVQQITEEGESYDTAKRYQDLTLVGVTPDGRKVVDFFNLVETKGLPLDCALTALTQANLIPDWVSFWNHSIEKGWNPKGTRIRLETAILETFGEPYLEQWKTRMDKFLGSVK